MLVFANHLHVRWTLDLGLAWVAFSYGFVSALGQGIALIPTMTIGMRSVQSIRSCDLYQLSKSLDSKSSNREAII